MPVCYQLLTILIIGFLYISFILWSTIPSHPLYSAELLDIFTTNTIEIGNTELAYCNNRLVIWYNDISKESLGARVLSLNSHNGILHEETTNNQLIKSVQIDEFKSKISCFLPNSCSAYVISHHAKDEDLVHELINFNVIKGQYQIDDFIGSLPVSRCSSAPSNRFIYTRKRDQNLFRSQYGGPEASHHPGRLLEMQAMHCKFKECVFVVQYLPYDNSKLFKVMFSLYYYNEQTWMQDILWEIELVGLGDDLIEPDHLHFMYFLTNPVIGRNNNGKMAVLVFLDHIFTLNFDEKRSDHGFELLVGKTPGLEKSELDVDLIYFLPDEDTIKIVLVSDNSKIFVIKHQTTPKSSWLDIALDWIFGSRLSFDYTFTVVTGFDYFFDIPELLKIELSNINLPTGSMHWELLGSWTPELLGIRNNKVVSIAGHSNNLTILLDNGFIYELDTEQIPGRWPTKEFFLNRVLLWISLVLVVCIFGIYEVYPVHTPRSTIALSSLLYITVMLMTVATVLIDL